MYAIYSTTFVESLLQTQQHPPSTALFIHFTIFFITHYSPHNTSPRVIITIIFPSFFSIPSPLSFIHWPRRIARETRGFLSKNKNSTSSRLGHFQFLWWTSSYKTIALLPMCFLYTQFLHNMAHTRYTCTFTITIIVSEQNKKNKQTGSWRSTKVMQV